MNIYTHREREREREMRIKSYFSLACIILFASLFSYSSYGGCNDLIKASRDGDAQVASFFITNGVDVNCKSFFIGYTPLTEATRYGHLELVKIFINQGADIEIKGQQESYINENYINPTLFMESVLFKRYLPDDYRQKNMNTTPLTVATRYGHPEIASFLINQEANISARGPWGFTPLHWVGVFARSLEAPQLDVAKILIDHGADYKAMDYHGHTPLDIAQFFNTPARIFFKNLDSKNSN